MPSDHLIQMCLLGQEDSLEKKDMGLNLQPSHELNP